MMNLEPQSSCGSKKHNLNDSNMDLGAAKHSQVNLKYLFNDAPNPMATVSIISPKSSRWGGSDGGGTTVKETSTVVHDHLKVPMEDRYLWTTMSFLSISSIAKEDDPTSSVRKDVDAGNHLETWQFLIIFCLCLIFGAANMLVLKLQNRQFGLPCENCSDERYYASPFFQAFIARIMMACLIIFEIRLGRSGRTDEQQNNQHEGGIVGIHHSETSRSVKNAVQVRTTIDDLSTTRRYYYLWSLIVVFDVVVTVVTLYSLTLASASTVQMLQAFGLLVTATLSVVINNRSLRVYQCIGVLMVMGGTILAGVSQLVYPDSKTNVSPKSSFLGIILPLGGTLFNSFQFVAQERLFKQVAISSTKATAIIGYSGLIFNGILLVIVHFCRIENFSHTIYMILNSSTLLIATIIFPLNALLFRWPAISINKYKSGLLVSILYSTRTVVTWVFELLVGWKKFEYFTFWGLLVLFLGSLTYNHMSYWIVPMKVDEFLMKPFIESSKFKRLFASKNDIADVSELSMTEISQEIK